MHKLIARLIAASTLLIAAFAFAGGEAGQLVLRDIGYRFIGHTTEQNENGSLNVLNSMFVHYVLPANPQHRYPIVMIHGGGGQGTDWLETPDGRDGWVDYFVADGWDVYVIDRPSHGRSQSNPVCAENVMTLGGFANTELVSLLSTADEDLWPGGQPTMINDAVVGWTASSSTAPYCGDAVAAETISTLLDEIGPAILIAHSAGGGSTFRVPDHNAENVVGIIAFEPAGGNPLMPLLGGPPAITNWQTEPALADDFLPVDRNGCPMQGENPGQLVNYEGVPLVLAATEHGLQVLSQLGVINETSASRENIDCELAAWRQAGVDVTGVYFPDRGLSGGGHFAMAQLDSAEYAQVFIELAEEIEAASDK